MSEISGSILIRRLTAPRVNLIRVREQLSRRPELLGALRAGVASEKFDP